MGKAIADPQRCSKYRSFPLTREGRADLEELIVRLQGFLVFLDCVVEGGSLPQQVGVLGVQPAGWEGERGEKGGGEEGRRGGGEEGGGERWEESLELHS